MIRKAFRMAVNPGEVAEYERRHRPVWRELEETLITHGVRSYSIFLDPLTSDLFGYVELESEPQWSAIASTDVCRRWWRYMRDVMPTNADSSPVSRDLREVFHLAAGTEPATERRRSEGRLAARRGSRHSHAAGTEPAAESGRSEGRVAGRRGPRLAGRRGRRHSNK